MHNCSVLLSLLHSLFRSSYGRLYVDYVEMGLSCKIWICIWISSKFKGVWSRVLVQSITDIRPATVQACLDPGFGLRLISNRPWRQYWLFITYLILGYFPSLGILSGEEEYKELHELWHYLFRTLWKWMKEELSLERYWIAYPACEAVSMVNSSGSQEELKIFSSRFGPYVHEHT